MQRIEENLDMIRKVIEIAKEENLFGDVEFLDCFTINLRAVLLEQSIGYSFQHTLFADEQ